MKVIDPDNLVFEGKDGEKITIEFTPHNTNWGITYRVNGGAGQVVPENKDLAIPLKQKADGSPTVLRIFFDFTNQSGTGGSYDVEVSGSLGGTFTEEAVEQAGPDPVEVRQVYRVTA